MTPLVSVVMCIRNVETSINACIKSILQQTFEDFEIVIVDDLSTDSTKKIIEELNNRRIKYFRNQKWLGISKSRNFGVRQATGDYIFFTDGDCIVSRNWIAEGLRFFKLRDCVGVEGRIYYVSKDFEPTFSDCILENRNGGNFMTGNMAYRKEVIKKVGGFDEKLDYLEDRDIALRILKYGKILFNPAMIVYHPRVVLTPKRYLKVATRSRNRIYLFRKSGEKKFFLGPILFPIDLLKILFPPLVFSSLLVKKFRTSDDYRLIPYIYFYNILERLAIWEECAKTKIFLI
jgi:glycosyltransferase involved in cell wall biosynthesis